MVVSGIVVLLILLAVSFERDNRPLDIDPSRVWMAAPQDEPVILHHSDVMRDIKGNLTEPDETKGGQDIYNNLPCGKYRVKYSSKHKGLKPGYKGMWNFYTCGDEDLTEEEK
ncbi:MAG: hypothetical protein ACK5KR_00115 [Breznakia sp.]